MHMRVRAGVLTGRAKLVVNSHSFLDMFRSRSCSLRTVEGPSWPFEVASKRA